MLGVRAQAENKEMHFEGYARRFALDAKMFRCRAAVHVENKDDIVFWSAVLRHFLPGERFHFIAGSRNEYGHETSGVTQCLKYYNYLSSDFFICIDSDYRYLMREEGMDARHFVLQTYTYSFENHHCFAEGLQDVCERVTHIPNTLFDFRKFLGEYSRIIYDLFIWHLYFMGADPSRFTRYEFNKFLHLSYSCARSVVPDNGGRALEDLRMRVERKVGYLGRRYPKADLESVRKKYEALGVTPATTYLFIRGHNVYDMISGICKDVCKALLKQEKNNRNTREEISALYRERNRVDEQLKQNLKYGSYRAIRQLEEDIYCLIGKI